MEWKNAKRGWGGGAEIISDRYLRSWDITLEGDSSHCRSDVVQFHHDVVSIKQALKDSPSGDTETEHSSLND